MHILLHIGENSEQYKTAGGGQFSLAYKPPISFPLYASLDFGYMYVPINLD